MVVNVSVSSVTVAEVVNMETSSPAQDMRPFPRAFVVVIATALVTQMAVGLVCNLTVLIVYHVTRKSRTSGGGTAAGLGAGGSQGAGPATNTISAALITNLNVVDVLISLSAVPLTLTYILMGRHHPPLFCICQEAFISFATSANALNLLVISIDRYHTIVSPFRRWLRPANLPWVLVTLWGLSLFGLCVPFLALTTSQWQGAGNLTRFPCFALADSFSSGRRFYFEIYYALLYLITNVAMIVCYVHIFRAAKTRINTRIALIKAAAVHLPTSAGKTLESSSAAQKTNERTMTKMTMMIVLTFMVCWAPHSVTSIATMVIRTSYQLEMAQITCVTLAYTATTLHPLLYAFMRRNFREAFKDSLNRRNTVVQRTSQASNTTKTQASNPATLPTVTETHHARKLTGCHQDNKVGVMDTRTLSISERTQVQASAETLSTFVVTKTGEQVMMDEDEDPVKNVTHTGSRRSKSDTAVHQSNADK